MNFKRALLQTVKVTIILTVLAFAFALYLIIREGFARFSEYYFENFMVNLVIMLIIVGTATFVISLLEKK